MDSTSTARPRRLPAPLTRAAVSATPPGIAVPDGVPYKLIDAYVSVRPAYLALATARSTTRAIRALEESGWASRSTDGQTVFTRGAIEAVVGDPGQPLHSEVLVLSGPTWRARFSAGTPDEVLADVAAALVEYADAGPDRADVDATLACLTDAGWEGADARDGDTYRLTAPDAMAEVGYGPDEDTGTENWRITAGDQSEFWDATLSSSCPELLVESVIGSLSGTSPVRRRFRDLPAGLLRHLDIGPEPARAAAARRSSPASLAARPGTSIRTSPAPAGDRPTRRAR